MSKKAIISFAVVCCLATSFCVAGEQGNSVNETVNQDGTDNRSTLELQVVDIFDKVKNSVTNFLHKNESTIRGIAYGFGNLAGQCSNIIERVQDHFDDFYEGEFSNQVYDALKKHEKDFRQLGASYLRDYAKIWEKSLVTASHYLEQREDAVPFDAEQACVDLLGMYVNKGIALLKESLKTSEEFFEQFKINLENYFSSVVIGQYVPLSMSFQAGYKKGKQE